MKLGRDRSACCMVVVCLRAQHHRQQQNSVDSVDCGRLRTDGVLGESRASPVNTVIMDDALDERQFDFSVFSMLSRCRLHLVLYGLHGKTTAPEALRRTRVAAVGAAACRGT